MKPAKRLETYQELPEAAPSPRWWHWLLSPVAGAVMALSFAPYDFSQLVWVALLPLLYVLWMGPARWWRAFRLGWLYGMGYYCTTFSWITEVGHTFGIPAWVFLAVAFLPLMAVYSVLVGGWAAVAATLLRPRLSQGPVTEGMTAEQRKSVWFKWAFADMAATLRSAAGCAALWVCIEWLRANGTLGFSWNSLGMALYDGLALAQWAEFVGTAALSFIPVFTSVIVYCALRRCVLHFKGVGRAGRPWDFYATVIIIFCLFAGGLTFSKLYSPLALMKKESTLQLPVVAVQINKDQSEHIADNAPNVPRAIRVQNGISQYGVYLRATMAAFNEIQQATARKAMEHPEMAFTQQLPVWVVWPESAMGLPFWRNVATNQLMEAPVDPYTGGIFFGEEGLPLVRTLVQQMGGAPFTLFTGVDEIRLEPSGDYLEPRGLLNSMACISGDFDSIRTVSKQHLMPFGEYIPLTQEVKWIGELYSQITGTQVGEGIRPGTGDEPLMISLPGTDEQVGVIPAICYEDTVGALLTKFVRKGPQVIVNISNDAWFRNSACGVQQARNAAFRCIELRRSMVRAANRGVCCAIAPNGAFIHALLKADGTPHLPGYSYAVLPVDKNAGFTLYAMLGDWAVLASLLLVLLTSAPAVIEKFSKKK
ncbi:MAG: apolipoprotein N-acyltransferase [Akkermansia sp.]|nr:apolipoprotein N-acyltransferase [Akkermansia sp.]